MSKNYNPPAMKNRVLVAANKRVKKARQSGKRIGFQYGKDKGTIDIIHKFNDLGFFDRLRFLLGIYGG